MFRESDYVPPRLHQSYKDRHVPEMQQRSQVSQFDDVPERRLSYQQHQSDADIAVPVTHDTQYKPTHPDADWSGLVSKDRMQKRHASQHRSQGIGIEQREDGIVSKPGCEAEFKHRTTAPKTHSTSSLIGGISAAEDQYKTTAHRQQNQEGISRDQLVLKNRIGCKKSMANAQYDGASQYQNQNMANYQQQQQQRRQDENAYGHHQQQQQQGYQYSATGMGGKNFTSNLGSALLSRVPDKPSATPIDPNDYSKTMLSQNHKPHPGYTGHKKW